MLAIYITNLFKDLPQSVFVKMHADELIIAESSSQRELNTSQTLNSFTVGTYFWFWLKEVCCEVDLEILQAGCPSLPILKFGNLNFLGLIEKISWDKLDNYQSVSMCWRSPFFDGKYFKRWLECHFIPQRSSNWRFWAWFEVYGANAPLMML